MAHPRVEMVSKTQRIINQESFRWNQRCPQVFAAPWAVVVAV